MRTIWDYVLQEGWRVYNMCIGYPLSFSTTFAGEDSNIMTTTSANEHFLVQLLTPTARLPTRGTPLSAGLDLYCARRTMLPPYRPEIGLTPVRVPLDLSMELPNNTYGRITGRSSRCMVGLLVLDGVIDQDYRGSVDVMMVNLRSTVTFVQTGERVAQLLLERCSLMQPIAADQLSRETLRGIGGFGSTGR